MTRKRRTRAHVLHDLAENFFERHALSCGFAVERVKNDYGIDLVFSTYDDNCELENGWVNVQVKASDNIRYNKRSNSLSWPVRRADLEHWLVEPYPVILVIYDGTSDRAYWLYMQRHFERLSDFNVANVGRTRNVRVPLTNTLNKQAIHEFRAMKESILAQEAKLITHA